MQISHLGIGRKSRNLTVKLMNNFFGFFFFFVPDQTHDHTLVLMPLSYIPSFLWLLAERPRTLIKNNSNTKETGDKKFDVPFWGFMDSEFTHPWL